MDSNLELPAWMGKTKGGKRTSAYTAPAAKKKDGKRVTRSRKEQMARQEKGMAGDR